jgi:hypothetical protein
LLAVLLALFLLPILFGFLCFFFCDHPGFLPVTGVFRMQGAAVFPLML